MSNFDEVVDKEWNDWNKEIPCDYPLLELKELIKKHTTNITAAFEIETRTLQTNLRIEIQNIKLNYQAEVQPYAIIKDKEISIANSQYEEIVNKAKKVLADEITKAESEFKSNTDIFVSRQDADIQERFIDVARRESDLKRKYKEARTLWATPLHNFKAIENYPLKNKSLEKQIRQGKI